MSAAPTTQKIIPLSEIAKHNNAKDLWMAINGKVYNVTRFIEEHPGGEEVLLEYAGQDATAAFEDVGHSETAVELLDDMYVGDGNPAELKIVEKKESNQIEQSSGSSSNLLLIVCIIVAAAAYYYYKALKE